MTTPDVRARAIRITGRTANLLAVVSVLALAMFLWPLFIGAAPSSSQHTNDAPFIFMAILPVLVLIVLVQLSDGGMDAKALAMLGVLSAVNAALRPLGAGTSGIETVFFLLILAGRVFGPGFGFVLGCTSLFASALLTAGVGPWLPFQMMTSAWVGMFAGLLPDRIGSRLIRGRREIAMLAAYGVLSALLFGALMNMWFWPFITGGTMGDNAAFAYLPGASIGENLERFLRFTLITSTLTWDMGRAITNTVALIVLGPPVLAVLRRAVRKARFDPSPQFLPALPR
ncbi:ECF transporter S component [Nakamurella sp. A5-74]|uniref:ECF transporter S component n=1 Tax=Nakamurella sp. A5-74 TaxID=3158264 RepID=A0AAU8DP36_9ACTN